MTKVNFGCGHSEMVDGLGVSDLTAKEIVCSACLNTRKQVSYFGEATTIEMLTDARNKMLQREVRRQKSFYHCTIPDWTGSGGMVDFWINDDGTYECMDSRIGDAEIRQGIAAFANMDWR